MQDSVKLRLLNGHPKRNASCKRCNDTELRQYSYWNDPNGSNRNRCTKVGPCNSCRLSRYDRWVKGLLQGEEIKYGVSPIGSGYTIDISASSYPPPARLVSMDNPFHAPPYPIYDPPREEGTDEDE